MRTQFRDLAKDFSLIRLRGKKPIEKKWTEFCHKKRKYKKIGFKEGDNAGICCGPASGVIVVDVDDPQLFQKTCKSKSWEIPATRTHKTGSGKPHYLFQYPDDGRKYGNRTFKGFGFDIRGVGGVIVAPGSIHPDTGEIYDVEKDVPIAQPPEWLLSLYSNETAHLNDQELDLQDAIKGLKEGERDEVLFRYACRLRAMGLNKSEIEVLIFHAASKCQPPFPKDEALSKINQAWEYPGCPEQIQELNNKHAALTLGGQFVILNEVIDPVFNRPDVTFSSVSDFQNLYSNRKIIISNKNKGEPKKISIAKVWLESPHRRAYKGVVFDPSMKVKDYFNLFRGLQVQPKKGNWYLFRKHLVKVIANGNKNAAQYLFYWMARIVQNPGGERPGTAVVLRGKQGTGKGVFVGQFGKLFGSHFLHIANQKQLTGRFNSHLKDGLLVFVDEGFWAGNKADAGILKGMITEPTHIVEPKFKDAFTVKNHINLIMASNSNWVVPASLEERRFFVLDVSDRREQDHEYFRKLLSQMDNGGREAMLFDLLRVDLTSYDLRVFPRTEALFDQIISSMKPIEKFWYNRLREGKICKEQDKWTDYVKIKDLYEDYCKFADNIGVIHKEILDQFSKEIFRLCPGRTRKRITLKGKKRTYVHYFPDLDTCREFFEQLVKMEINWKYDTEEEFLREFGIYDK